MKKRVWNLVRSSGGLARPVRADAPRNRSASDVVQACGCSDRRAARAGHARPRPVDVVAPSPRCQSPPQPSRHLDTASAPRRARATDPGEVSRQGVRHLEVGGSLEDRKGRPVDRAVFETLCRAWSLVEVPDSSSWPRWSSVARRALRPWSRKRCQAPRSGHLVATPLEFDGSRGAGEPAPETVFAERCQTPRGPPSRAAQAPEAELAEAHTPRTSPDRSEIPVDRSAPRGVRRLEWTARHPRKDAREVQRSGRRVRTSSGPIGTRAVVDRDLGSIPRSGR